MYRAYHAMRGSGLSGPGGSSTHAVYIFVTMLRKLIQDHEPRFLAASFDLPGPTFRYELVTDYKANRAPMPPDLAEQIPWVHEACEALGVPILTSRRFEADDVIGTLAAKAHAAGFEVAIVTGDKDFFQLVTRRHHGLQPADDGTWFDAAGVKEKFGVLPEQVVDVLALMGDSIDNIKGVPGIGEKGARDLIAKYGSLEALLAHAGEITQQALPRRRCSAMRTTRGRAASWRGSAPTCRSTFDPDAVRYRGPTRETLLRAVHPARLPDAGDGVRADRGDRRQALRRRRHGRRTRRQLVGELRAAGRFAFRVLPTARARCAPASSAWRSRPRRAQAHYVPVVSGPADGGLFGEPDSARSARPRSAGGARRAGARARRSGVRARSGTT